MVKPLHERCTFIMVVLQRLGGVGLMGQLIRWGPAGVRQQRPARCMPCPSTPTFTPDALLGFWAWTASRSNTLPPAPPHTALSASAC